MTSVIFRAVDGPETQNAANQSDVYYGKNGVAWALRFGGLCAILGAVLARRVPPTPTEKAMRRRLGEMKLLGEEVNPWIRLIWCNEVPSVWFAIARIYQSVLFLFYMYHSYKATNHHWTLYIYLNFGSQWRARSLYVDWEPLFEAVTIKNVRSQSSLSWLDMTRQGMVVTGGISSPKICLCRLSTEETYDMSISDRSYLTLTCLKYRGLTDKNILLRENGPQPERDWKQFHAIRLHDLVQSLLSWK